MATAAAAAAANGDKKRKAPSTGTAVVKKEPGVSKIKKEVKKPKSIAPEWLIPRNSVSFCIETKLFAKILTFLRTFNNEVNFIFEKTGIKIALMDGSMTSLLHVRLICTGLEQWNWTLDDFIGESFNMGIHLESALKIMKVGNRKFVRFVVKPKADTLKMEFFGLDATTQGPKIVDPAKEDFPVFSLRLINIKLKDLQVPDNAPDVTLRLVAAKFSELLGIIKACSDEVSVDFAYDKKVELVRSDPNPDEDMEEVKKEIHGKSTKKMAIIDKEVERVVSLTEKSLLIKYVDKINGEGKIPFNLYFEGIGNTPAFDEDASDDDKLPPWERYDIQIKKPRRDDGEVDEDAVPDDVLEAEVTENLEYMIRYKMREIQRSTGGGNSKKGKGGLAAAKKGEEENQVGIILGSKAKEAPLEMTTFASKLFHNATLGKTINDHVILELYDNMPICMRYDLPDDMGSVKCYIAPKIPDKDL